MRWTAALVLAALTACSGAATAPPPSPTPDVDAAGTVQEFVGEAPLEPGRTRYSVFDPPFTFVVPEGWAGGHDHVDFFDIWNGEDLVIGFGRPTAIPGSGEPVPWDPLTPKRALHLLGQIVPAAEPVSKTTVDGRPALEMSFAVDRKTHLLTFTGGAEFNAEPPWRQRAIVFEVDGTLLLILVQRSASGDEAAETAVLSSVDFEA